MVSLTGPQRGLLSPRDRHRYAKKPVADAGTEKTEKIALTAPPALQWVSSDTLSLAEGKSTASKRSIRFHIMLDHCRKQRLAKLRTHQRHIPREVALLPPPFCVIADPLHDMEYVAQAVRQYPMAHDKKSEA